MTNISVCAHGLHCPRQNRRYSDYNFRTDHLINSRTYVLMHFNNSLYPFDTYSNFSFQFLTAFAKLFRTFKVVLPSLVG